jgi:hypothetical protein
MKGRTVESLLRQMRAWHDELARAPRRGVERLAWAPCGIPGLERTEGTPPTQRIVRVVELLTSMDLVEEGRVLRHCVASYAVSCAMRRAAIFSLRLDEGHGAQRLVTLEVSLPGRALVQARGRFNRRVDAVESRIIRGWAQQAGVDVAGYVL